MIQISHPTGIIKGTVHLPYSKSIINRLLILKHLYFPSLQIPQESLSNDTIVLNKLLNSISRNSSEQDINAEDAGTVLRFLQPYLCVKGGSYSLTGTNKLMSRPSFPLIESLTNAGFNIKQDDAKSFISIKSNGVVDLHSFNWEIDGTQSSQFASSLVMIAPFCQKAVTINLTGDLVSLPYLDMTIKLMNKLGIEVKRKEHIIYSQPFETDKASKNIDIERDWSGASYFFGIACLSKSSDMVVEDLSLESIQGDKSILDLAHFFELEVIETSEGVRLVSNNSKPKTNTIKRDYSAIPDLALTEMTIFAAKKVTLSSTGTSHLAYKESNRLKNIEQELGKLNLPNDEVPIFNTYNDHRMAMSLSMIATLQPVIIKNPKVINKSFPDFWEQLRRLGFEINEINESSIK